MDKPLNTVRDCVAAIREGSLTSELLVSGCLDAIGRNESEIHAWTWMDRERALERAREMDDLRRRGKPTGALHGIPVGLKDIFDTAGMPTENGSPIYKGRTPEHHCAAVEKLLEAGAVILGKTATTELAYMEPTATRNPHDPSRTPGGSSSGSAAAVAAGHVPLALGSQTGGSTIRPASFCGVYGMKPSRGLISRRGVFQTSASLDQPGVFARDPGDVALLCDVLSGYDAADPLSRLAPRPQLLEGYLAEVPVEPNFAWIDMPYAGRYAPELVAGCDELLEALGPRVDRIPAPQSFAVLIKCHRLIYDYELYRCLEQPRTQHADLLSASLTAELERAVQVSEAEYREALEIMHASDDWFRGFFNDYDAVITPSALGEANPFEDGTGDAACCTVWTLCGLPCISLPLLVGAGELPIGVQLAGALEEDDRLMRTTRWLLDFIRPE